MDDEENGGVSQRDDSYAGDEQEYSHIEDAQPMDDFVPMVDDGDGVARARRMLDSLWQKYFPDKQPGQASWAGLSELGDVYRIFELDPLQPPTEAIITPKLKELYMDASTVLMEMDRSGLRVAEQPAEFMIRVIFAKIEACQSALAGMIKLHAAANMQPADFGPANRGMWRFLPSKPEAEPNAGQRMRMFAINDLAKQGYRRYHADVMRPLTVKIGDVIKNTCAWERVFSIHDYVKTLTGRRLTDPAMWMDITNPQGIAGMEQLEKYLVACDDPEVPEITTDRTIFSFKNGVYLARTEQFVPYLEAERYFPPNRFPVACKHHDVEFDPNWTRLPDPMDIPTPAMDTFMNTQKWSPNVMRWAYVLFGRLLYDVGEFDDWQLVPFLKGSAGAGKSVILEFISKIYEDGDVGIISNTIEKQFGLAAISDKFIAIADDVRKNMQMDQSEFQNTISGNGLSCAAKFKDPKLVKPWTCTQLWSGNEVPGFHDNSGSIGRRFAILLMAITALHPDGRLPGRMMEQMAAFICKANRCYRNMVRRYGPGGVWNVLPKEFSEQRAELSATSNALVGLLNSEIIRHVQKDESLDSLYMPLDKLMDALNVFAASHNMEKPVWGPDYYRGPLLQAGLRIGEKLERRYYPRHQRTTRARKMFVYGIDLEMMCEQGEANGGDAFAAAAADAGQRKRARVAVSNPDQIMIADD
jgi:hypothetical protein